MDTRIIGLMGAAGSGKSTVAQYLAGRYDGRRYSFAEPLKQLAMRTLGFTLAQCYGTQAEKEAIDPRYGFSPRWFLQRLGTEGCRSVFGDDFWSRMTLESIARDAPRLAVIEDVRFINEADAVRAAGGQVWRLECPDRESAADAGHASESEWQRAPYDVAIAAPRSEGAAELLRCIDATMAGAWR